MRNIEITGFCNQCLADYTSSLIIINQKAEAMGVETAKRVLKRIQSPNEDYDTRIITSSCILNICLKLSSINSIHNFEYNIFI